MRWRDVGIAAAIGLVLGVLAALGVFGRSMLVDGVMPAYASWYVPVLAIVVALLPLWRRRGGSLGPVIARALGMVGVAWLAVLIAVAGIYLIVFPLTRVGP